ncbi:hypothetical protein BHM03_00017898 [Ensete ventricosum]|nr:hypothetical protein BHM03_00017898 [Ensete ventricosum]
MGRSGRFREAPRSCKKALVGGVFVLDEALPMAKLKPESGDFGRSLVASSVRIPWPGGDAARYEQDPWLPLRPKFLSFLNGYMWRKKKDGRTIGEAHERLKVC